MTGAPPTMVDPALIAAGPALFAPDHQARGLPSACYLDPALLALERQRIFARHWLAIGHGSDLPAAGSVVPVTIAGWPLLLTRDRDGRLHGFHNSCPHRGLLLADQPCHDRPTITCPYHGWAFDLGGRLRATPDFGGYGRRTAEGFDPADHGLVPVRLAEAWGGLIFADLSGTAPAFDQWAAPLFDRWAGYRFDALRHVHRETTAVAANWKLAAENFVDTLHLDWVHPQITGYSRPEDHYDILAAPAYGSGSRQALPQEAPTPPLPGFPDLPADRATVGEFIFLYPNLLLFLLPNQLLSIILDPMAPDHTGERLDLAVIGNPPAAACQRAMDGWRQLNDQDRALLARLHQGRHAPSFDGGCFSAAMEQVALAVQRRIYRDLTG